MIDFAHGVWDSINGPNLHEFILPGRDRADIVVTKGAGRVSEVSARFTLDALPGKQMAIDADLNAGLITPDEAKARRIEVATEADFYGSMDG